MAGYHCWTVRVVRWYPLWVSGKHTIRWIQHNSALTMVVQLRHLDNFWSARDGVLAKHHGPPWT